MPTMRGPAQVIRSLESSDQDTVISALRDLEGDALVRTREADLIRVARSLASVMHTYHDLPRMLNLAVAAVESLLRSHGDRFLEGLRVVMFSILECFRFDDDALTIAAGRCLTAMAQCGAACFGLLTGAMASARGILCHDVCCYCCCYCAYCHYWRPWCMSGGSSSNSSFWCGISPMPF